MDCDEGPMGIIGYSLIGKNRDAIDSKERKFPNLTFHILFMLSFLGYDAKAAGLDTCFSRHCKTCIFVLSWD